MIPLPTPPVRGQTITADLQRAIIEAIRRCRPIAGKGICLQETANGTVIASTAAPAACEARSVDYPFKATPILCKEEDGAPVYAIHVRKGALYEVEDSVAAGQTLSLENLADDPDDPDAWRIEGVTSGSLYVRKDAGGYTLSFGEPADALCIIASCAVSSSSPAPTLVQRVLGDVYLFSSQPEQPPLAWEVRKNGEAWQIYSPYWVYASSGSDPGAYAEGMQSGWNTLAEKLQGGTLYALLTHTEASGEGSSATPETITLAIVNTLPSPLFSAGVYNIAVPIGSFTTVTAEDGTQTLAWTQLHLGIITETVPLKGPKGEKGDTGPQGPQGPTGTFDTGSALSLDVVTAVNYDTSTHKLTYTKQTLSFYGTSTGTASTVDITEATAHSAEH